MTVTVKLEGKHIKKLQTKHPQLPFYSGKNKSLKII